MHRLPFMMNKGLSVLIPQHYYSDDNPKKGPVVRRTSHANLLFNNWLNYFVYQETPYNLKDVAQLGEIVQNG